MGLLTSTGKSPTDLSPYRNETTRHFLSTDKLSDRPSQLFPDSLSACNNNKRQPDGGFCVLAVNYYHHQQWQEQQQLKPYRAKAAATASEQRSADEQ